MNFLPLPKAKWHEFFDGVSSVMEGKLVEIEVAGLDLGDQIESEWIRANGMTYEPREDVLYVYTEPPETADHAIPHPREVFVEVGPAGVNQVVILDADDHKQFVRFRSPLELPATSAAHETIAQLEPSERAT